MSFQIRVSARASRQIRAAGRWWLENRPKGPEAFAEEIERGFELLRAFPSTGEHVPHSRLDGVHRILLARIRYHLYYTVSRETETIEILSLWHTSRGSAPVF